MRGEIQSHTRGVKHLLPILPIRQVMGAAAGLSEVQESTNVARESSFDEAKARMGGLTVVWLAHLFAGVTRDAERIS
jgi:hypothetical protein